MVNKVLDLVLEDIGQGMHPYTEIDDKEAYKAASDRLYKDNFIEADNLIFHGAPSPEEDRERFDMFERVGFALYASGNNVNIHFPEDQRSKIEDSEVFHEDVVNYFDPNKTEDDFSLTEPSGSRIQVTSDYHAEAVDQLSNVYDNEDYLVISAELEPDLRKEVTEAVRNVYNQILGPRFES